MIKRLKNKFLALVLALGLASLVAGAALAECQQEIIVDNPNGGIDFCTLVEDGGWYCLYFCVPVIP